MRQTLRIQLGDFGLPKRLTDDVPNLPTSVEGALLYGSQARGDAGPDSDVDLLLLSQTPHPSINHGAVSVSFYSAEQLATGAGTLFGSHLRRDGKILIDPSGRLRELVEDMGEVDVARLFSRAREMSVLFIYPEIDLPRYLAGLTREARYLLRSCLYAKSIADGSPSFSVRALAERNGDPELVQLLASRHRRASTVADFENCTSRLRELLGGIPVSGHGSLEATVVNEWGKQTDLLSMAFMALGVTGDDFDDYAEVDKILL